ncbi:MAG: hypothetical protein ACRYGG_22145 [Janthinobacterium lividum]
MKEFNIAKALKGDSVVTRDGRKVLWMSNSNLDIPKPVLGLIENTKSILSFAINGRSYIDGAFSSLDLFMAPVEKKLFINVRRSNYTGSGYICDTYSSKEAADMGVTSTHVCRIEQTVVMED